MTALWVYKNNAKSPQEGDWDDFLRNAETGGLWSWGDTSAISPESRMHALDMVDGDLVLCWQSNTRKAVGLAEFVEHPGDVWTDADDRVQRDLYFSLVERFDEPVSWAVLRDLPAVRAGKAFKQGHAGSIFQTTAPEARAILKRCGRSATALRGLAAPTKGRGEFGTPEENAAVEEAAIAAVDVHYSGWDRHDRQDDRVGYDFEFTKGKQVHHVEVKGRSGAATEFLMTEREWETARTDPRFRLCLVTNALDPNRRKLHEWTGKQLRSLAEATPVTLHIRVEAP